jgi:hypothetical protein
MINLDPQVTALHHRMVMEGLSCNTIRFFFSNYETLKGWDRGCTQLEMAQRYGCQPPSATPHLKTLVDRGYLIRRNYRRWILGHKVVEVRK